MKKFAILSASLLLLPLIADAQGTLAPVSLLIQSVGQIVGLLIPIMIGVAMLAFFYGLYQYIRKPSDESRKVMVAGIVSLFIMVSIWGIIKLGQTALLGGTSTNTITAPHFPTN